MTFLTDNPFPTGKRKSLAYLNMLLAIPSEMFVKLCTDDVAKLREWARHTKDSTGSLDRQAACCLGLSLITAMVFSVCLTAPPLSAGYYAIAVLLAGLAIKSWVNHDLNQDLLREAKLVLADLTPLAETREGCSQMLELVDGYLACRRYRDSVLDAGRELLGRDLDIAVNMVTRINELVAEQSRAAECRRLHCISD